MRLDRTRLVYGVTVCGLLWFTMLSCSPVTMNHASAVCGVEANVADAYVSIVIFGAVVSVCVAASHRLAAVEC